MKLLIPCKSISGELLKQLRTNLCDKFLIYCLIIKFDDCFFHWALDDFDIDSDLTI